MVTGPDRIRDEEQFAVYTIRGGELVELAMTSKEGIGVTVTTLVAEGEFRDIAGRQRPLGIRDRANCTWVIDPFALGARE